MVRATHHGAVENIERNRAILLEVRLERAVVARVAPRTRPRDRRHLRGNEEGKESADRNESVCAYASAGATRGRDEPVRVTCASRCVDMSAKFNGLGGPKQATPRMSADPDPDPNPNPLILYHHHNRAVQSYVVVPMSNIKCY